jgi:hypothetical protein
MNIHIHRSGQSFGPYSIERARALLKEGRLSPEDLAWYNGAPGWVPLASVPEITAEPEPATAQQPVAAKVARPSPAARYANVATMAGYGASFFVLLYYLLGWVPRGTPDYLPAWWPMLSVVLIVGAAVCAVVCLAAGMLGARMRRVRR